jgi:hypothetical protein
MNAFVATFEMPAVTAPDAVMVVVRPEAPEAADTMFS